MIIHNKVLHAIVDSGVVAVLRGNEGEVKKLARAAFKGGIKIIEVTTTVPNATSVLSELKSELNCCIGMGTVLDSNAAIQAIQTGADFIVTPHLDPEIINIANEHGVPIMPGTFTITEMVTAMKLGCEVLKLFPADQCSPSYISNLKGPLPNLKIMPTGGVDETNIKDWVKAGAVAVGIGSQLKKSGGVEADEDKIISYAAELVKQFNDAKLGKFTLN